MPSNRRLYKVNPSASAALSVSPGPAHSSQPFAEHKAWFEVLNFIAANYANGADARAFYDLYHTSLAFQQYCADWVSVYGSDRADNQHLRDRGYRLQIAIGRCSAGNALPPIGPILLMWQDELVDRDTFPQPQAVKVKYDLEQKLLERRAAREVKSGEALTVLREFHLWTLEERKRERGGDDRVRMGCFGTKTGSKPRR